MNPAPMIRARNAHRPPMSGVAVSRSRLAFALVVAAVAAPSVIADETPAASTVSDAACGLAFEVRFVESAPRDRFELTNVSTEDVRVSRVSLALDGSRGKLIFDTADGGTGVEVFQPFRVEAGDARLLASTLPDDGGERIELAFEAFEPGARFVFSIDVDDRLTRSELGQIRVAGGEIEGASVTVTATRPDGVELVRTMTFDAGARAGIAGEPCAG